MELEIPRLEQRLEQYSKFITGDGDEKELDLYDDTSEFDDVLEVDMGRSMPMLLETKVAQQAWQKFKGKGAHSNWINGVTDVINYAPAVRRGPVGHGVGQPDDRATVRLRQFTYDSEREGTDIRGKAKIILDLEIF